MGGQQSTAGRVRVRSSCPHLDLGRAPCVLYAVKYIKYIDPASAAPTPGLRSCDSCYNQAPSKEQWPTGEKGQPGPARRRAASRAANGGVEFHDNGGVAGTGIGGGPHLGHVAPHLPLATAAAGDANENQGRINDTASAFSAGESCMATWGRTVPAYVLYAVKYIVKYIELVTLVPCPQPRRSFGPAAAAIRPG